MAMLETPSRILRRIEALEAQDSDLPSLPSFPEFEDSSAQFFQASSSRSLSQKDLGVEGDDAAPYQSTPPLSSHTTRSTVRPPSASSSSATRFANSMRTSIGTARRSHQDSFEVSKILSTQIGDESSTSASIPDVYSLPHVDNTEDIGRTQDLASNGNVSTTAFHPENNLRSSRSSASDEKRNTPNKKPYDYSISLRSEPKLSPLSLSRNVTVRKTSLTRTRTPSLSRTTPSPTSISSNSTPRSTYSPLPRGNSPPPPSGDELLEREALEDQTAPEVDLDEHTDEQNMQKDQHSVEHQVGIKADGGDQSQDEHQNISPEPTFSSEEHLQSSSESGRLQTPFPNAFSSPIQPNNTTPTSSFSPRVYNMVADATATPAAGPSGVPDDFTTPYNRRRSFLLSLVHSTTRPRMAFPTPHPLARAAPTPRARAHPLSQAWTPSPSHLDVNSRSSPGSSSSQSPHDRLSFISTASSHDLTVHPRANASFDPVTGAKGVGRFNAAKLNTYLHGLNRRLQEENETLVSRLRMHGEEVEMGQMAEELERDGFHGVEEAVLEDVAAMRDELEKCELEKDVMKKETDALAETLRGERDEAMRELDIEREERKKDKERWKDRMTEVERGVEDVIKQLERRLEEAERDANSKSSMEEKAQQLEARCLILEEDLNLASRRAEKAENALASSSDLGAEVKRAYERATTCKEEVRVAKERVNQLERLLRDAERAEEQIRTSSEDQLAELDEELRQSLEAQQSAEANALELEDELKAAHERLEEINNELGASRQQISQLVTENENIKDRFEKQEVEAARAAQVARQMEDALEESERKMIADEEELASLRTKAARLAQELETIRMRSQDITSFDKNDVLTRERTIREIDAEQLEAELDKAHREIGRLNHLLSDSPTRKAIDKAKDVRIEILEKEKDYLTDRVKTLTSTMSSHFPGKEVNQSTHSPVPHRQVLVARTPKTPGPPLKDYSWLNDNSVLPKTSPLVAKIEHLQQELHLANNSIDEKVNMLEEAGMGIVGLTEKLEDARARTVTLEVEVRHLTRREERRLRRLNHAKCLQCGGRVDLRKVIGVSGEEPSSELSSLSVQSDPQTPPSKTIESLKLALQKTNVDLVMMRSQWDTERKQLLGKNAVLQDAANRLNVELGEAKVETRRVLENGRQEIGEEARARTNVQKELGEANQVVNDLEDTLKKERLRLRALSTEQTRLVSEKKEILNKLQRAQSDMDDVRTQLDKVKHDNRELEAELRETVDQRARLLEVKVSENHDVIESLRKERESLAADHATLQHRYVEASAQVNRLRREFSTSQLSHDERRHELDLRVSEIEDLRRELSERVRELERVESENNQARADRSGIVRTVTSLESALKRVRKDAEVLGRDLKDLKVERDRSTTKHRDELSKADRAQKQLSAQLRLAKEQLELQQEKTKTAIAQWNDHVCQFKGQNVEELHTQHKNECKGLMVQIRYLKAKFTRESVFRADLSYQKHYLLGILSTFEKSEKQILAAVARIGFPLSPDKPCRKRPTLRTVASVILFISRAKRASEVWREHNVPKSAVQAALLDVRRHRIRRSLGYT